MKKIIILLILISSIGILCFYFHLKDQRNENKRRKLYSYKNTTKQVSESSVKMSYGWSIHPDSKKAIKQALSMMLKTIKEPGFIILYVTEQYDENIIVRTIREHFPKVKLFGANSYKGVFTNDGVHLGKSGALAIMGYETSDSFAVGVHAVCIEKDMTEEHIKLLTKQCVKKAIKNSGRKIIDTPSLVIIANRLRKEEEILAGLKGVLSNNIPFIGGTVTGNTFKPGIVIANDVIVKKGLSIAIVYSNRSVGQSFHSSFIGRIKTGRITSVKGHRIKEIDKKPAVEVYKKWANGYFNSIDNSEKSVFVTSSVYNPLAKAIQLKNGKIRYITIHPWQFHPDGSMNVGIKTHHGDILYYLEGTKDAFVKRIRITTKKALINGNIKMKNISGGIHFFCAGVAEQIGFLDGCAKMLKKFKKAMNNRPFIGAFTGGEQGTIEEYGFFHGNLMSSLAVFEK